MGNKEKPITIVSPKAEMTKKEIKEVWKEQANYNAGLKEGIDLGRTQMLNDELKFLKSILNNQSIAMQEGINRLCIPTNRKGRYMSVSLNGYIEDKIKELLSSLDKIEVGK